MFTFHHTAISVSDLERSLTFYSRLGFTRSFTWHSSVDAELTIVHMKLHDQFLELFCYAKCRETTVHADLSEDLTHVGVRHFALQVPSIDQAKRYIEDAGLAADIQIREGRTGVRYFFITDPDHIFVEIIEDKREL